MQWGTNNPHPDEVEQRERLSAWLDGALDASERATLERHLERCVWCRHELAGLRQTRELLSALPEPRLPRSFALPLSGPLPLAPAEESAPLADEFAHASAAALASAPPWRSARGVSRWAWAIQRIGGMAAVLGLSLLIANALLSHGPQTANSSVGPNLGAISAPAGASRGPSTQPSQGLPGETNGSPQQTPAPGTATYGGHNVQTGNQYGLEPSPPVLPLAGAGLLGGGAILLISGIAVGRRRGRHGGA